MYGLGIGAWAWTALVPQPTEIARKTLTGSYKCGFYLGTEFRSPIDIVWEDANIGEALLEISRPITTGLFYIWAASSVFDALATWQTMMYAQMMCDLEPDECLLASGIGSFYGNGGSGVPTTYVELFDPNNWHAPFGGSITVPVFAHVSANAVGYLTTHICNVTSCKIMLVGPDHGLDNPYQLIDLGAVPNSSVIPFSLDVDAFMNPGEVAVAAVIEQDAAPLVHTDLFVNRFTVVEKPDRPERNCIAWAGKSHLIVP
jgi:hypothetical protein